LRILITATGTTAGGFCLVDLLSVVDLRIDPYKSTGVDLGKQSQARSNLLRVEPPSNFEGKGT